VIILSTIYFYFFKEILKKITFLPPISLLKGWVLEIVFKEEGYWKITQIDTCGEGGA